MQLIDTADVQRRIDALRDRDLYVHLEMTSGAYTAYYDSTKHPAANFITNAVVRFFHGGISGSGPYRVGLKMENGWIYTEGLTHYEGSEKDRLIMAGHDTQGKLIVSLQLSPEPF